MLKVDYENPIIDQVRLEDTEYDIDCPKCKKTVYSRRDSETPVSPALVCPNCGSGTSLVEVYFRINDSFGHYSGSLDGSYLICDNRCGWQVNNRSDKKIKHDECGAEIGTKFIVGRSIKDYDIEDNDPRLKSVIGKIFGSLFKK